LDLRFGSRFLSKQNELRNDAFCNCPLDPDNSYRTLGGDKINCEMTCSATVLRIRRTFTEYVFPQFISNTLISQDVVSLLFRCAPPYSHSSATTDAHYCRKTPIRHFITFKHHRRSTPHLSLPQFHCFIISLAERQNCSFLKYRVSIFSSFGRDSWK